MRCNNSSPFVADTTQQFVSTWNYYIRRFDLLQLCVKVQLYFLSCIKFHAKLLTARHFMIVSLFKCCAWSREVYISKESFKWIMICKKYFGKPEMYFQFEIAVILAWALSPAFKHTHINLERSYEARIWWGSFYLKSAFKTMYYPLFITYSNNFPHLQNYIFLIFLIHKTIHFK